jgi:chromosome segregation ATPase
MVDPTGTVGAPPPSAAKSDLDIAFEGAGGSFLERVTQLTTARDEARQALAALELGKDIKATKAAGLRNLALSKTKLAQAEETVTKAQADAAAVRAAVEDECKRMRNVAQADATKTKQMAQAVKDDADAYAKDVKAQADKLLATAQDMQNAAQLMQQEATAATNRAAAVEGAAKEAETKAKKLQADLQAKIAKLHGVLRETLV